MSDDKHESEGQVRVPWIEFLQAGIVQSQDESERLRAEVERLERELAAMMVAHGAARALALRAFRERDRLATAVRLADAFLAEVVAYGLVRQDMDTVRKAFREALAGLDPAPAEEGGEV